MANLLLVMFNQSCADRITADLKAFGYRVTHVRGAIEITSDRIRGIDSNGTCEITLNPRDFDCAIVSTTCRKIGNYTPGEIVSYLFRHRTPTVAVYEDAKEELELRVAGAFWGIKQSEHLGEQLLFGTRSVKQAIEAAHESMIWTDMDLPSANAASSLFFKLQPES